MTSLTKKVSSQAWDPKATRRIPQSIDRTLRWGANCSCVGVSSLWRNVSIIPAPNLLLVSPNVCNVPMNLSHFSSDTIGAMTYGATSIRARYSSKREKTASSASVSRSRSLARVIPRHSMYHASSCNTDASSNRSRSGLSTCVERAASYAMRWPIACMSNNERGRTSRSYTALR